MKVVYLSPAAGLGGAERVLLDLLAGITRIKPNWALSVIAGEDGPLVGRTKAMGVATEVLPFPAIIARLGDSVLKNAPASTVRKCIQALMAVPAVMAYVQRLRHALRDSAPDIIHSNGSKMNLLGALSCPRGLPLVWHLHDYVSSRPVMSRLFRATASHCAAAIANSRSVARDVRPYCPSDLPIYPVLNGVDLESFVPVGDRLDLDAHAGLQPPVAGTVRVGLIATMAKWKGQEVFLRALAKVPPELHVRGYVIGGPIYRTSGSQHDPRELTAIADALGIRERVGFTGFVENPAAAMRALDVVVHASTAPEPFGRVIAEAMACGRPVIASESGGATEILEPGVSSLTHHPSDFVALADRIATLASNARLRRELGNAGRIASERRFDRMRQANQIIDIYRTTASA